MSAAIVIVLGAYLVTAVPLFLGLVLSKGQRRVAPADEPDPPAKPSPLPVAKVHR